MIEGQEITVVGGTGEFGQHIARLLDEKNKITISGRSVGKAGRVAEENGWEATTNVAAVKDADVVIVSVPIEETVDVIHEIGPYIDDNTLLCDVTSVKQKPCKAMSKYSNQVLGMHPMYAPSNSPEGQKVVLCPIEGDFWTAMEEFWVRRGADVHLMEPVEHDRAMSVVQGLTHFTELVFAETMRRVDTGEDDVEDFSTPVYQLIKDLTARMLNQQPDLYHSIQQESSKNGEVRKQFVKSAKEMRSLIGTDKFDQKFDELGGLYDTEGAQERTDDIIEYLTSSVRKDF